uniref:Cytochrome c oxidase subunit 2 n=1 Tax=Philanthus triangulum TaxID=280486 RepID=H9A9I5_9HYME|nr:cytochrome c oxidase subunit II [Philanthus triangulum]AET62610.1 cytochrome c oxidase subunit II [Philanthus triangulum]QNV11904.1 cytochrome c oxidase subunit II [Philanthus triangulum]
MSHWYLMSLQYSGSLIMNMTLFVYELAMLMIILITSIIMYLMLTLFTNKFINRNLLHGNTIELIWTIIPILILFKLAIPSLKLLYMMDELLDPLTYTVKVIGHQWYWSYEYPEFNNFSFDSYMINNNEELNLFRLLDVDNRMVLPIFNPTRILITSSDVIHSWAIPSLGIKVDATPGRINQSNVVLLRYGLFFGQCSEICGANHSFMPIVIESTNSKFFHLWTHFMTK